MMERSLFRPDGLNERDDALVLLGRSEHVLHGAADEVAAITEIEQEKADSFRQRRDKEDYLAAHVLVRRAAAMLTRTSVDAFVLGQLSEDCGRAQGHPSLVGQPQLYVSLSHTHGAVSAACAFRPFGIDIERWASSRPNYGVLKAVVTDAECAAVDSCKSDRPAGSFLSALRIWHFCGFG
jgi:phosphopantetheinyl transferase